MVSTLPCHAQALPCLPCCDMYDTHHVDYAAGHPDTIAARIRLVRALIRQVGHLALRPACAILQLQQQTAWCLQCTQWLH
jgi:hypothetical protein